MYTQNWGIAGTRPITDASLALSYSEPCTEKSRRLPPPARRPLFGALDPILTNSDFLPRSLNCYLTCVARKAQVYHSFPILPVLCVLSHGLFGRAFGTPGHHSSASRLYLCVQPAGGRRTMMNHLDSIAKSLERKRLSRRNLIRGAVGAVTGAGLFRPRRRPSPRTTSMTTLIILGATWSTQFPGASFHLSPLESPYTTTP